MYIAYSIKESAEPSQQEVYLLDEFDCMFLDYSTEVAMKVIVSRRLCCLVAQTHHNLVGKKGVVIKNG